MKQLEDLLVRLALVEQGQKWILKIVLFILGILAGVVLYLYYLRGLIK